MKKAMLIITAMYVVTSVGSHEQTHRSINAGSIFAEFSIGDVIDRLTILTIKRHRITDQKKLDNVILEYESIMQSLNDYCKSLEDLKPELAKLADELLAINTQMWELEDLIRHKEALKEFDAEFIELARSVYHTNDQRCAIKRLINTLTGSRLIEEKQYVEYKKSYNTSSTCNLSK